MQNDGRKNAFIKYFVLHFYFTVHMLHIIMKLVLFQLTMYVSVFNFMKQRVGVLIVVYASICLLCLNQFINNIFFFFYSSWTVCLSLVYWISMLIDELYCHSSYTDAWANRNHGYGSVIFLLYQILQRNSLFLVMFLVFFYLFVYA